MQLDKIKTTGGDIKEYALYHFTIFPYYSVHIKMGSTDSTTFILWGCLEKYK